ncbi:hypothetical protein BpHYR1_048489 [Brachionus plicatilis]|uniref:Uncharacterized protein n=1 Tax=Brachionus plicatilis TaxID=10195 RepID=A0A3M7QV07_BRAPC|nr:hypothetical protein BpHYR1_048489 [Brachionus plicatilis]
MSREIIAAIIETNGVITEKASICHTFNELFHSVFDEPTSSSTIKHIKKLKPYFFNLKKILNPEI